MNSDGVIANSVNTTVEFYNTSGTMVSAHVSEVYLYPGYNPETQYGDIALISVNKGALTDYITDHQN